MAWTYIGTINKEIQFVCQSTDTKLFGDVGARCFESDTGNHYINVDGTDTGWVEYKSPKLTT